MTYTLHITTKDIYGVDNPTVPKGYRVVKFKPPKKGEVFIAAPRPYEVRGHIIETRWDLPSHEPRLVVVECDYAEAFAASVNRSTTRVRSTCDDRLGAVEL